MAQIDTTLPFRVKGFEIDPANAFAAAQATKGRMLANEGQDIQNRGGEMRNALGALQLEEATGQFNAMKDYRTRLAAGDDDAMEALTSYPEMQLKMTQTLDALDESERLAAVSRGKDVAEAARRVQSLPAGSEAQKEAWNTELDRLVSEGDISQEWADANRDTPSEEVLTSALRMGESLDEYIARKDAEARKKLEDAKEHPKTESDLTLSQRLEVEKAARERVDAAVGNSMVPLEPDVAQQMFTDAKNDILKGLGITPSTPTVTPPGEDGDLGLGDTPAGPEEATPPAAWASLSPEAQTAAAETLLSRLADSSIDRDAEIADFDAHFGEGAAAAVLKAHGD